MLVNKKKLKEYEIELNKRIELDTTGSFWLDRAFHLVQALYEIPEFEFSVDLKSLQECKIVKIQNYLYDFPGYDVNTCEQDAIVNKNHCFVLMTLIGEEYYKQYLKSIEDNKI